MWMDEYKVVAIRYSCGHEGKVRMDSALDVSAVGKCWKCVLVEQIITVPSVPEHIQVLSVPMHHRLKNKKMRYEHREERDSRWLRKQNKMKDELVSAFPEQIKRNLLVIQTFLHGRSMRNHVRARLAFYRLFKLGFNYLQIAELATDFCGVFVSEGKVWVSVGEVVGWLCSQNDGCSLGPLLSAPHDGSEEDV